MALGVINIHPGLLPFYRGCTAVEWSILNDDKVSNTAHFIDSGFDTGPIIKVEWYKFSKKATYQNIRTKVYSRGCRLAAEILFKINNNDLFIKKAKPQNNLKGKYWSPINKKNMQLVYKKIKNKKYKYQTL